MGLRSMGFVNRVESHETSIGIPDICIILSQGGGTQWIELKYTADNKVVIRPAQIMWIRQAQRMGYRPVILTRVVKEKEVLHMFHRSNTPLETDSLKEWELTADWIWGEDINYAELEEMLRGKKKPR